MLMILTRTQPVRLSISGVQKALLCLQRFWALPTGADDALVVECLKKPAHRACLSVVLNMHPNRQFPANFVVHMPLCVLDLFSVTRPLHSNRGGRGNRHLGHFEVRSLGGVREPSR